MSSGLIVLIFIVALILIVGYVVAVILRKRNEALLAALEERKEKLYNLPVNDEVEAVKNMHLIGQSQVAFREWNQKWVDLSLNSFADIENNLFEAEGYNNSFRFMKAKQAIDNIESQIQLIDEDIKAIRKNKRIVVVWFMPWICLRNFKKKSLQTQIVMAVRFLKLKNKLEIFNLSFHNL